MAPVAHTDFWSRVLFCFPLYSESWKTFKKNSVEIVLNRQTPTSSWLILIPFPSYVYIYFFFIFFYPVNTIDLKAPNKWTYCRLTGQPQDLFLIPDAKQPIICGNKTTEDVCRQLICRICQLQAYSRWRTPGGPRCRREGSRPCPRTSSALCFHLQYRSSTPPPQPPTPSPPPPLPPSQIVRSSVPWKDDRVRSNWSSWAGSRGR